MPSGETGTARSPATADSFAGALRRAIVDSGLGLERLQARLLARGVRLSTATLSYWQSGRSEPGRRSSLAALAHLEEVLKVPPGSLAAHLAKPVGSDQSGPVRGNLDDMLAHVSPLPEPLLRLEQRYRPMLTGTPETIVRSVLFSTDTRGLSKNVAALSCEASNCSTSRRNAG